MKTKDENTFVGRLRKALKVKTSAELAGVLEVSPSLISDYANGRAYPPVAKLIEIARKSKASLDWLLFGDGEEPVSVVDFLDPEVRSAVEAVAGVEERGVEEVVADLVTNALEALAAEMIRDRRTLRPKELRKLKALMRLLEVEEAAAVTKPTRLNAR